MDKTEIELIRDVWKLVDPDKATHGVEILIRLFNKYPETRARFARLKMSSPEMMRDSARVRAHGARVVASLGCIISQLEDMELVDETIFLLGDSHNKQGALRGDMQKISTVILEYLQEVLSDAMTPTAAAAYGKLMNVFVKKISVHLDS